MSVLINELEIVPRPSGEGGGEPAGQAPAEATEKGGGVSAGEVMTLLRKDERRRARVWAH